MAITNTVPVSLAALGKKAKTVDAGRWMTTNQPWVKDMIQQHESWIRDAQIDQYQAAYDGVLDEIAKRDKARGDDVNYRLVS